MQTNRQGQHPTTPQNVQRHKKLLRQINTDAFHIMPSLVQAAQQGRLNHGPDSTNEGENGSDTQAEEGVGI